MCICVCQGKIFPFLFSFSLSVSHHLSRLSPSLTPSPKNSSPNLKPTTINLNSIVYLRIRACIALDRARFGVFGSVWTPEARACLVSLISAWILEVGNSTSLYMLFECFYALFEFVLVVIKIGSKPKIFCRNRL